MRKRIQNMVRHNFLAKLISLVMAVSLWVIVMDDQNPMVEKEYNVPVTLSNVPRPYRIDQDVETVKIRVRAQRSNFVNVDSSNFRASADLTGLEEGSFHLPVHVDVPQGFELMESTPEEIAITMDPIIERQIRAEMIVTGAAAPNVTVGNIHQDHQTVTVVGPKSYVDQVDRVVGYVGLTGNAEDFNLQVPLSAINSEGRESPGVRIVPSNVNVEVELARGLTKKVVPVKPILGNDLEEGYVVDSAKVSPASIEVAGTDTLIAAIGFIGTENISLKERKGPFTIPVKLVIPEGITVTNPEVSVNIVISKKK